MAQHVDFGLAKFMGFMGMVAGAAIAIGVPWVVLTHAGTVGLGGFAITFLATMGVVGGVTLAIVATFFSIVIPSKVKQGKLNIFLSLKSTFHLLQTAGPDG